jgi:hypothetical protein
VNGTGDNHIQPISKYQSSLHQAMKNINEWRVLWVINKRFITHNWDRDFETRLSKGAVLNFRHCVDDGDGFARSSSSVFNTITGIG